MLLIVAYGSLLNRESLESTIYRSPEMTVTTLRGWERIFNAAGDISFLNLRPSNNEVQVATFEASNAELRCLRAREGSGRLIKVRADTYAFVWTNPPQNPPPPFQSYINVCLEGADQLGIDFWRGTVRPKWVIDDVDRPFYSKYYHPWSKEGKRASRALKALRFLGREAK